MQWIDDSVKVASDLLMHKHPIPSAACEIKSSQGLTILLGKTVFQCKEQGLSTKVCTIKTCLCRAVKAAFVLLTSMLLGQKDLPSRPASCHAQFL